MVELLYKDDIESYFEPALNKGNRQENYKEKFSSLVERANKSPDKEGVSTRYQLQYYKDESIITFYTFATADKIRHHPQGLKIFYFFYEVAFSSNITSQELKNLSQHGNKLLLEYPLTPTPNIISRVKQWFASNKHPIKYIRDKFPKSRVEDPSMADVAVIYESTPPAMVCFECKFMSDISCETKYHFARNQIARNLDVGMARYPDAFYFILVTPKVFKKSNSRLYSYKMREYQSGNINALRQDLLLGSELSDGDLLKLSRRIGWISWEELAEVIFQYKGQMDSIPFDQLRQFYKERNIFS